MPFKARILVKGNSMFPAHSASISALMESKIIKMIYIPVLPTVTSGYLLNRMLVLHTRDLLRFPGAFNPRRKRLFPGRHMQTVNHNGKSETPP